MSCSWLGPNIQQLIETLTFVETKQEKKITDKCHTVKNAEIPAEVIIKVDKNSIRKLSWKAILLITVSINIQENQEITHSTVGSHVKSPNSFTNYRVRLQQKLT